MDASVFTAEINKGITLELEKWSIDNLNLAFLL